jgi:thiamine-phosphate pyrophosphorylase
MIITKNRQIQAPYYEPIAVDFRLYLITDRRQTGGKPLLEAVEEALRGGVRAVQLREKDLDTREYLKLAYQMRTLTLKFDSRLFINDRVDIAIAVDADGVHLGRMSMPAFAVRKLERRLIIGVSTHSAEEAIKARDNGADFITLGPVFQTESKMKYGKPLGLDTLEAVAGELNIPVYGIGGIKLDKVKDTIDCGAEGVALISGIFSAKNVKAATMKYMRLLK